MKNLLKYKKYEITAHILLNLSTHQKLFSEILSMKQKFFSVQIPQKAFKFQCGAISHKYLL